ncbi:MAG: prolyl oligopeptidase family serine peptidase, partial [bacterium]|nr:prolyl oligopeptidase family serine peptidase [bacterium]
NHFEFRTEVNMAHITLMGISFGGYFATRAAGHEPRIKVLIANSPILDLHRYMCSFVGMDPLEMPDSEDFTINDLSSIPNEQMSPQLKAQTEHLITRFGQKSFKSTFSYLKTFIVDYPLPVLKIPCLALMGIDEGAEPKTQFNNFCDQTKADNYIFNNFEGAGSHCQVGNPSYANAVIYDWLDNIF